MGVRDYPNARDGRRYEVRARARGVPDVSGFGLEAPLLLFAWLVHGVAFPGQWKVEVADLASEKVHPISRFHSRQRAARGVAEMSSEIEKGTWSPGVTGKVSR